MWCFSKTNSWASRAHICNNKYSSGELCLSPFMGYWHGSHDYEALYFAFLSNIYTAILLFVQQIFTGPINTVYPWRRDKLYLNSCSKLVHSFGRVQEKGRAFSWGEPKRLLLGLGLPSGPEGAGSGWQGISGEMEGWRMGMSRGQGVELE